jgi:hypothetical protein
MRTGSTCSGVAQVVFIEVAVAYLETLHTFLSERHYLGVQAGNLWAARTVVPLPRPFFYKGSRIW